MYFHQSNYNASFSLAGNPDSSSYVLGEIVTDNLTLNGTSGINMALNPNATYSILKASLFR